ncbi:hypothetical protein [Vagococcus carniphilus]|uniref:Uncharacterized protein n=1 Tax=Vagococcus carniphilus TaxID=218144 RepID=A0A430B3M6_9ENTE|nr:hypothetical protein [Vagococcus carniphilus]MDT2813432.1 hypothetical protein [Vagococcus carniphilus]MDT2830116.1 hypothetical protein [Vagococcus carniphilus]MDT2834000.1 hypothetical protein [Vagococcus carniphilus]MDT2838548.1 hypothetical protein [Vagococcus carniphilus]MDT2848148.1 hypothetical protein [Vagococcus carniphilus]
MFQQQKVYKSLENRNFTPESLLKELEDLKEFKFDDVSYTGISLNIDMLITQYLRNENFELIEVQGGLAKKNYATWFTDLSLAINIFNHFADYTKAHFNYYLEEAKKYQEETGHSNTSPEYKAYFEQGNSMYFHDVLHSVFDLSRKIDLSIDDFNEALLADNEDASEYVLPEKKVFESK